MDYLSDLGHIAYTVIGPVLVFIAAGYTIGRRVKATADVLAKVLLYIIVPGFVFWRILATDLKAEEYGTIIAFSALMVGSLLVLAQGVSRIRGHERPLRGAFTNSVMLYNSANFGIPVLMLAFAPFGDAARGYAEAAQIVIAVCQGFTAYTLGAFVAAAGQGSVGHAITKVFKLPFIYALVLALVLKSFAGLTPEKLDEIAILSRPLLWVKGAYVPLALMTLGSQMARVKRVDDKTEVGLSLVLRLAVAPLVALGWVTVLGVEGQLAQILVIGAAVPSAVASVVLAVEFKNRPDFAGGAVLVSTVLAGVTVPIVIFLVQTFMAGPS